MNAYTERLRKRYRAGAMDGKLIQSLGYSPATIASWNCEEIEQHLKKVERRLVRGISQKKIEQEFNLPYRAISKYFKQHPEFKERIQQQIRQRTRDKRQRQLKHYFTGRKTQKQIAKAQKVNVNTVCRWVKEERAANAASSKIFVSSKIAKQQLN